MIHKKIYTDTEYEKMNIFTESVCQFLQELGIEVKYVYQENDNYDVIYMIDYDHIIVIRPYNNDKEYIIYVTQIGPNREDCKIEKLTYNLHKKFNMSVILEDVKIRRN